MLNRVQKLRPKRVLAGVSRRLDRPELLAAFDRTARRDWVDAMTMRAVITAALPAHGSFVDVGANTGQWTRQALDVAPTGKYIAFEPIPDLCKTLQEDLPAVDVRCAAVSDRTGTAEFCFFPDMNGWSGLQRHPEITATMSRAEWISVRLCTLDDELGGAIPSIIKIDVEGAELGVLRGAVGTIGRHQPLILLEHEPAAAHLYDVTSQEVWSFIDQLKMRVFSIDGRGPFDMVTFERECTQGVINWLIRPQ